MEALFTKVRTQEGSKLPNQQQAAATLLAVEEMIAESGTAQVPAAYFATMFTLLEQQADSVDDKEMRGAVLYLLAAVFPELDSFILRSKFREVSNVLAKCYQHDSESAPAVKSITVCVQSLLESLDAAAWSKGAGIPGLQLLIKVAFDPRPKVRRKAQESLKHLLSNPPAPLLQHPMTVKVAEACLEILQSASKADPQSPLYALALCRSLAAVWPPTLIHSLCETILPLPKLNNSYMTVSVFEVFETLFKEGAAAFTEEGNGSRMAELLYSLLAMKPDGNDQQLAPTWLRIIGHGYVAFSKAEPVQCGSTLAQVFALIYPDLQGDRAPLLNATAATLCVLIEGAMGDAWLDNPRVSAAHVEEIVAVAASGLSYRYRDAWAGVLSIIASLYTRLDARAFPLMNGILATLGELRLEEGFEHREALDSTLGAAIGAIGPEAFLSILPLNLENPSAAAGTVGRAFLLPLLKEYIGNTELSFFTRELQPLSVRLTRRAETFAKAGREIEAKVYITLAQQIWRLLPGFFTLPTDLPETFSEEFLTLILEILANEPDLRPVICTALQLLVNRFNAFLELDPDTENPDLYHGLTRGQASRSLTTISRHALPLLATLSNLYAASPPPSRGFILDTIRCLMGPSVSKPADVLATFSTAQSILSQAIAAIPAEVTEETPATDNTMAHTMIDLLCGILSSIQPLEPTPELEATLRALLTSIASQLGNTTDPTLQKKAYKLLGRLMTGETYCRAAELLIRSDVSSLVETLVTVGHLAVSGAKKDRLTVLTLSVGMLTTDVTPIPLLLSEAVLGTKEVNEQSRAAAYDLLVAMGNHMLLGVGTINTALITGDETATPAQATLTEFFTMVTAGLTGSTAHMVSATVAALARLLFEFHRHLPVETVTGLLETILLLVERANREVVKAALGFVKVSVVTLPPPALRPLLGPLIAGILRWSGEHKAHFKSKARHLLERLVRRFGIELIEPLVPESDRRLITNIRKRKERAARQKAEGKSPQGEEDATAASGSAPTPGSGFEDVLYGSDSEIDEDGGDSDGEVAPARGQRPGKAGRADKGKKEKQTWIREDAGAGPVDFLDQSIVSRVVSAHGTPKSLTTAAQRAQALRSRRQSQLSSAFSQTKDGRMLIQEEGGPDAETDAASVGGNVGGDSDVEMGGVGEEGEENLYMEGLKNSRDDGGFRRGQGNKVRFSNKAGARDEGPSEGPGPMRGPKKGGKVREEKKLFGREYKAKKAGGDIKRGALDPYAYIPLSGAAAKKGGRNSGVKGVVATGRGGAKSRK